MRPPTHTHFNYQSLCVSSGRREMMCTVLVILIVIYEQKVQTSILVFCSRVISVFKKLLIIT